MRIDAMMARLVLVLAVMTLFGARAEAQGLVTEADFAVIIDADTGVVLYSKNADVPAAPASMSKMMTVLMAFEAIKSGSIALDDEVTISEHAWRTGGASTGGSTMFLEVGSRVSIEDLLRGVIIQSGNDASIALAEAMGGSEELFADEMTRRAEELGMANTTFRNATGLPHPEHRMSVRALAEIARLTIRDHPELYAMYAETEFTWNGIRQFNRNPLLRNFPGADGLKTGHTEESGYGLTASAVRGDVRRIVVFNGMQSGDDRVNEAERLMRAAFADFRIHEIYAAGDVVGRVPVFLGDADTLPVTVAEGVTLGYHRGSARDANVEIVYQAPLKAPIAEGAEIGEVVIDLPGSEVIRRPVYAAASVERLGLMQRANAAMIYLVRTSDDE